MKFTGKIVLIGDNLSSHFSEEVIALCKELNIAFVCLLPNSTHLGQPLDVGFYGPLKKHWRAILDNWKSTMQKKSQTITKERFPSLLTKLCNKVTENGISSNLVAGFRKCGIYPFDPLQVINRMPKKRAEDDVHVNERVSEAVIDMLKDLRHGSPQPEKKRRKKLDVEPGKSISLEDFNVSKAAENKLNEGDPELSDANFATDEICESECDKSINIEPIALPTPKVVNISDYMIVEFPLPSNIYKYYIAQVKDVNRDFYTVTFLKKGKHNFTWPKNVCEKIILSTQVKKVLSAPTHFKTGLIFNSEELGNLKIQ